MQREVTVEESGGAILVDKGFEAAQPGVGMRYFEDERGTLTVDDVSAPGMASRFVPSKEPVPNFGYTGSAVWVLLPVINAMKERAELYLEVTPPGLDHVDVYYKEGGKFSVMRSGDTLPYTTRKVFDRNIVFPVSVPAGVSDFFIRFRSDNPLSLDITLWDRGHFFEEKTRDNALLWLFYGMLASLALYNVFVFFLTRDLSYLYYVFFMTFFLLWIMCFSGTAYQYFWPESVFLNFVGAKFSMRFVLIFSILFVRKFLDTPANMPRYDKLLLAIPVACVLEIAFTLVTQSAYADVIGVTTTLAAIIVLSVLAAAALYRKIPLAKNYFIAWSPILAFGVVNILRSYGVLPQNWFTHYSTHIGSVAQGMLFSMALTSRMNRLRDERLKALEALDRSEERYRLLFENTAEAIFLIQDRRIVLSNPAAARLLGYERSADISGNVNGFVHPDDIAVSMDLIAAVPGGTGSRAVFRILMKDGSVRWADGSAAAFLWEGEPANLVLIQDITERKTAEENLRKSLEEKDVLIKEIHHRVKNNLQVVSSLLALSQSRLHDESDREVFIDSRSRIRTMALIHEKLYQSGDLMRIDFSAYIRELAPTLMHNYAADPCTVALHVETSGVVFNIDTAIPCGLIVNELVTNCLKHAFPGGRGGTIVVSLVRETPGGTSNHRLTVGDDGVGIRNDVDLQNPQTLGFELVKNLTRQLKGSFSVERGAGTRVTIEFSA